MVSKQRAFVTGATGQDGFYLSNLLLEKGYEVHAFVRRGAPTQQLDGRVVLYFGDLTDPASLRLALHESQPHEIYNLGAQSHVAASFHDPVYTHRVTATPVIELLEYVRIKNPQCRLYQAGSSEMFGIAPAPQNERSPLLPRSPYAVAKVAAHQTVGIYRDAYGLFAVGGILFNHESPRRPTSFVTRKITSTVGSIFRGEKSELVLGNVHASRDWGFAGDYVKAMWLMLQQDKPQDFVIASGSTHTVQEFVCEAFEVANQMTGRSLDYQQYVRTDHRFERPAEVPHLLGNPTKACEALKWVPEVNFKALVRMMVEHDLQVR